MARVSTSNTIQLGDSDITRINTSGTLYAGAIQNTPIGTISPTIGVFTDLTVNGTVSGITKATIGLSNVDNTSDLAKPISTLTQAALDTKVSTATFSSTVATKENATNKSTATDLGGLNPSDVLFPTQKAVKDYITANTASGNIADGGITTIKLADGAVTNNKIATGINKSKVGLNNVENTADLDKPISTATQIALDTKVSSSTYSTSIALKAPIESPTFSGTVSGITKAMVGLSSVDNTSDLGKPVSTLTQAALDNKANKDSTSFSKDILINGVRVGRGPNNLENTVLGKLSLNRNTTGNGNTAIGLRALYFNTVQEFNTAIGNYALNSDSLKVGSHNVAIGLQTLRYNEAGNNNVAVGNFALYSNGVGSNNTALGFSADVSDPLLTVTNSTAIGSNARVSTSNTIQFGDANVTRINTSGTLYAGAIQNTPIGTISPTTGKFTDLTITGNTIGLTKSMVGLSLVDNTSDLSKPISTLMQTALDTKVASSTLSNSLSTKENSINKSTDTDLGGSNPSDDLYPSQRAVKAYITANNVSGGISDGSITTVKLADGSVTGVKLASSITGYKNFVAGAGKVITSTNNTPDLILPSGSTLTGGSFAWQSFIPTASGKLSMIEFETINPSNLMGTPPTAYVEIYAGQGVSGTLLGRSSNFTISMFGRSWKSFDFNAATIELNSGNVYTAKLIASTSNQDWIYGDNNLYNLGSTNVSSSWDHNFKTHLKLFTNDEFLTTTVGQNLIGSIVSNATHTGDVTGATSLTITDGVVSTAKISDGAITTAKLANTAVDLTSKVTGLLPTSNIADGAITTAKLANTSVDLSTKVTGLLPTANIADGAITSSKISNGEVGLTNKVSGILPTSNGGTGTATSTANLIFATPNGTSGAPIFRSLVSADFPTNLSGYIQNATSSAQSASININGSIIAGGLQNTPIGNTTSSSGAFTTLTTSGTASIGGTLTVTGVATFSETPILSTTSASKALFTNSNKGIVSNNLTGTGNVVMSASPILTGTVSVETISSTQDLLVNGIKVGIGSGNKNSNSVMGVNALNFNTTGEGNIALGYQSLLINTTGSFNTGLGYGSLTKNNGNYNIAIGNRSLFENTLGNSNIALGNQSLEKNKTGLSNIALGFLTLYTNTSGNNNIAFGDQSLTYNTIGSNNFAAGYNSMVANNIGTDNIAIGYNSLFFNNSYNNIGLGRNSLFYNQNGTSNYAGGYKALFNNTSGNNNIAIGYESLMTNSTGSDNIGIGKSTLIDFQSGTDNIAIGKNAGSTLLGGSNNIIIGAGAQPSYIVGVYDEITLGNSSIITLRSATNVITSLSDRRDKIDIENITEGINFIKQLKPVTFTWNARDKSKVGIKSAGFIAQDLLSLQKASTIGANLDLVSENNPEKLEARYNNLLPVMVKAIQDQQTIIEQLKKELAELKQLIQNK